jgi:dual specificity MAP kinase phosphatase
MPSKIIDNLYLGDEFDSQNRESFSALNIKAVINVTPDLPNSFEDEGVVYLRLPITDSMNEDISKFFQTTWEFIETHIKNGSVLVHCRAGISRSATIVIAYLMKKQRTDCHSTLEFVRNSRPRVEPNFGFEIQLFQYKFD